MKFNPLPVQKYLHSVLDYDPDMGIFTWRNRASVSKRWNTRYANKVAGQINDRGYVEICLNYRRYKAHRLAWVYMYGDVLGQLTEVDHRNRDRADNSIDNLRLASKSNNSANSAGKSKSGLPKGVEKNKKGFCARIMVNRKRKCLGTYASPEKAHQVYLEALESAHGEFARSS